MPIVNLDVKKELLNCEIGGKYYAGGPVKHGKVRWSIYHTKSDYARPDYPGYSFGHPLEARTDLIESGEAMLDEKGQITVPVPIGKDVLSGKYGIEVTASVVDFDGRASSDSSVYQADPDYLVGISNHPPTVKPGDNQTLYAIVIDRKGSKVTRGSVLVQVMERGYTYIQKRNAEGYLYNEQQQIWRSQLSAELAIKDDRAVFDFDFTRGGEYLIAFTYKDGTAANIRPRRGTPCPAIITTNTRRPPGTGEELRQAQPLCRKAAVYGGRDHEGLPQSAP